MSLVRVNVDIQIIVLHFLKRAVPLVKMLYCWDKDVFYATSSGP